MDNYSFDLKDALTELQQDILAIKEKLMSLPIYEGQLMLGIERMKKDLDIIRSYMKTLEELFEHHIVDGRYQSFPERLGDYIMKLRKLHHASN